MAGGAGSKGHYHDDDGNRCLAGAGSTNGANPAFPVMSTPKLQLFPEALLGDFDIGRETRWQETTRY